MGMFFIVSGFRSGWQVTLLGSPDLHSCPFERSLLRCQRGFSALALPTAPMGRSSGATGLVPSARDPAAVGGGSSLEFWTEPGLRPDASLVASVVLGSPRSRKSRERLKCDLAQDQGIPY